MKENISIQDINEFETDYQNHLENVLAQRTVLKNGINSSAIDFDVLNSLKKTFSVEVDNYKVCNQKQSGRCWMFAGFNVLRRILAKNLHCKEIEISQAYLQFFDKLEKANFTFEKAIELANEPITSENNIFILDKAMGDGGHFAMFVNLVKKYGIVPIEEMPDLAVNPATADLNKVLTHYVNQGVMEIRAAVNSHATKEVIETMKQGYLNDIYRLLVISLGTPVKEFTYEYKDKDDHFVRLPKMTPLAFFEKYIGTDLDDYISLCDAPIEGKKLYQKYTSKLVNNVIEGEDVIFFNIPVDQMKKICVSSLKGNDPVWFAADVGAQSLRKEGYLADKLINTNDLFHMNYHMNKEERLTYRTSFCTHAMTFTGVNVLDDGTTNRWKVENSWGKENGFEGYYVMSDAWFTEYVMQIIVHKKYIPQEILDKYQASDVIEEGPNNTLYSIVD